MPWMVFSRRLYRTIPASSIACTFYSAWWFASSSEVSARGKISKLATALYDEDRQHLHDLYSLSFSKHGLHSSHRRIGHLYNVVPHPTSTAHFHLNGGPENVHLA